MKKSYKKLSVFKEALKEILKHIFMLREIFTCLEPVFPSHLFDGTSTGIIATPLSQEYFGGLSTWQAGFSPGSLRALGVV